MFSSFFINYCMHSLSRSIWDLVPWPGIEPGPPALGTWSLNHWATREIPKLAILYGHSSWCHQSNYNSSIEAHLLGFPDDSVVKNPLSNAGSVDSVLIWEDPTCHGAIKPKHPTTEPVLHSPGTAATEPHTTATEAQVPGACALQ